ncbi:MAG TPA: Sec-independent protein translocase protein TatB [Rhizomicrobium sp.]|nr:Sec-independent protein translocase protein TatB [Rhizomicrobium sp.]
MFDLFSWSHILILLAVALVVVGPKDLPKLMHMVGKWAGKARGMANEFKKSFDDMARQSELDELRKEIEDLKSHQSITDLESDLNKPLETVDPAIDIGPEPRAGEFAITDTAPPPVLTATEPSRQ